MKGQIDFTVAPINDFKVVVKMDFLKNVIVIVVVVVDIAIIVVVVVVVITVVVVIDG